MTEEDWRKIIDDLDPPWPYFPAGEDPEKTTKDYTLARNAFADWCEERGDFGQAKFQRWLVANLKCPLRVNAGRTHRWHWYHECSKQSLWYAVPRRVHEHLPRATRLPRQYYDLKRGSFRSRWEADQALRVALNVVEAEYARSMASPGIHPKFEKSHVRRVRFAPPGGSPLVEMDFADFSVEKRLTSCMSLDGTP